MAFQSDTIVKPFQVDDVKQFQPEETIAKITDPASATEINARIKKTAEDSAVELSSYKQEKKMGLFEAIGKEVNETKFYEGEIGDRLRNMRTRMLSPLAYVMPGVSHKELIKELDEEAAGFSGGGSVIVPVLANVVKSVEEYVLLSGAFKVTGIAELLDKAGIAAANKILPSAMTTLGEAGAETFVKTVARKTIETLPKTTQFMGVWGGLDAVQEGKSFSSGYIKGVEFGAILSAATPFVIESAKAGMDTKVFEKAMTRFDKTFPKLATKIKGAASKESMVAVLDDLKQEAIKNGKSVPAELNITNLNQTAKNIVKSIARRRDGVLRFNNMQNVIRKGEDIVYNTSKNVVADEMASKAKKMSVTKVSKVPTVAQGKAVSAKLYRGISKGGPIDEGMYGKGKYYSPSERAAEGYAVDYGKGKGKVISKNVELTNAFVGTSVEIDKIAEEAVIRSPKFVDNTFAKMSEVEKAEFRSVELTKFLKDKGYDGVVMTDNRGNYLEVVDFEVQSKANKLKKEVHSVQKDKKIGDIQYHQLAFDTTGKRSAADMNNEELIKFTKEMQNTDTTKNFIINNKALKAQDTGAPIISPDETIAKQEKLNIIQEEKRVRNTNNKIEVAKSKGKEYNHFDQYAPERVAIAKFEDNTSIPVTYLDHNIKRNGKIRSYNSHLEFGKMLTGAPHNAQTSPQQNKQILKTIEDLIKNTSIEDNDKIAKYLFSEDTRKEVIDSMSSSTLQIANTLDNIAQNSNMAIERMQESLRLWIGRGKAPSDIDKFSKEQKVQILEGAKEAKESGKLAEFTQGLFSSNVRFGLREYYYPSSGEATDAIIETVRTASQGPLAGIPTTEAQTPSLIGSETLKRKGKGVIKKGSVYANFMKSYERVAVRNEIANDLENIYKRFNSTELSTSDKKYLEDVYSAVMLKGTAMEQPYDVLAKLSAAFWRTHLSVVTNPVGAIKATTRNALQFLAEGGQVLNLKEFYRTGSGIATHLAKGGTLETFDPELANDFHDAFRGYISQKGSLYREMMFIELDKKAKSDNWSKELVQQTKMLLDLTGSLYVGVDTVTRATLWPTVYKSVKDAANNYISGKITYKKFLNLTNIDTMMQKSQTSTAIDLLKAGNVRELSKYIADTYTFDICRGYAAEERAGVERTREKRTIVGIYTYPRGVYDLFHKRGFKPMIDGIREGNAGKAKRGAENIAKGLIGRTTANVILTAFGFGAAYSLFKVAYTPLAPAFSIVATTASRNAFILYQLAENKITTDEAISALAKSILQGTDDIVHFIPDKLYKKKEETKIRKERKEKETRKERETR